MRKREEVDFGFGYWVDVGLRYANPTKITHLLASACYSFACFHFAAARQTASRKVAPLVLILSQ